MHDLASGTVVRSANITWIWNGYSMNTSPVSDGSSIYIISPPNLIAFGPNLGSPRWTTNGAYKSQPAVADGVVYAISGGQLRATDATTRTVLWTFAADSALKYTPVVAAGYVYVASDDSVFAVEIATQNQAWKNTPGGWLSIACGQLLVAAQDGTLVAWSLGK
jgi:outer membrane protein assembly factor BamB